MDSVKSAIPVRGKGRRTECSRGCAALFHSDSIARLWSRPNLSLTIPNPLVTREFFQTHRPARADLVCADTDLCAHPELGAIRKARGSIPIHRGGIDLLQELFRAIRICRHNRIRV